MDIFSGGLEPVSKKGKFAKKIPAARRDFFVIAHNIRSLLNVGSIFRTADAFGVSKIFLTGYTGRPDHAGHRAKISKTALGAENFVPWEYQFSAASLIARLKKADPSLRVLGLENNVKATALPSLLVKGSVALLLGEEVSGIPPSLLKRCDQVVEIPMFGKKESLNVSVAFGIAAYELRYRIGL